MKTFALLITVLVVATGAVWLLNRGPARTPPRVTESPSSLTRAVGDAGQSRADETHDASAALDKVPASHSGAPAPIAPTAEAGRTEHDRTPEAPGPAPTGHNAYHAASASLATTRPIRPPEFPSADPNPNSAPPGSSEHATPPGSLAKTTPAESTASSQPDETGPKFTLGPDTDVKQEEDGWTRLDGRFLVRGAGTKEDPVIVPWELLVSASETYRPRAGLKEMPRRVADLKGKHVRVTGYALFPLMSLETTEVLLMRNQWDGCCIGVPPTPYDAVEVTLAKPADRKDTFVSFVTIEGVLDVDPYVNRDFLLGLYVLKDAALSQPAKGKDDEKGL